MKNNKEFEKWLDKADEDFHFSSSILPDTKYFSHICFFFHQAAEKYLKAYIVKYGLEFRKIHDLTVLLAICVKHKDDFEELKDACQFLNAFYIDTRYPVHWPMSVNKKEALKAQKAADEIREFVKKNI